MSAQTTKKSKPSSARYLDKNDPVFVAIKASLLNDLSESARLADTGNEKNRALAKKLASLSEERQQYYQEQFLTSLRDYALLVHIDFEQFMMIYSEVMKKEQPVLVSESELRVRSLGPNKYAAELWEDGVKANSEEKALLWAAQISKRYPGDEKATIAEVKATYARARKEMLSGKQQRYTKLIAFLYTRDQRGAVVFNDPGRLMMDLKETDIH